MLSSMSISVASHPPRARRAHRLLAADIRSCECFMSACRAMAKNRPPVGPPWTGGRTGPMRLILPRRKPSETKKRQAP
ncbi:hypothetical protein COLSTE_02331 [Collinsella stercoris DSM 13279]|uniref:Uncharacterized protein n=1 Tax=Collinsella stercoris DSM 13279 TaxID=445975 RepID=B6GDZ6_9ACTN|nr:hypothetical protein COLSTE_02331 [Collinsella stercoris DSM 13279]